MSLRFFSNPIGRVAAVAALMLLTLPARAALPNQDAAAAAGLALVETAATGDVGKAFDTARDWLAADDQVLTGTLEARQRIVSEQTPKLGRPAGRVQLVSSYYFAGGIRTEYLARYSGGNQRWLLKFRHTSLGWTLFDLQVVDDRTT